MIPAVLNSAWFLNRRLERLAKIGVGPVGRIKTAAGVYRRRGRTGNRDWRFLGFRERLLVYDFYVYCVLAPDDDGSGQSPARCDEQGGVGHCGHCIRSCFTPLSSRGENYGPVTTLRIFASLIPTTRPDYG